MNLALCLTLGFIGFIIYIAWRECLTYLEHKRLIDEHFRRTPPKMRDMADILRDISKPAPQIRIPNKDFEASGADRVPGNGTEKAPAAVPPLASSPSNESEARGGVDGHAAENSSEAPEKTEMVNRQRTGNDAPSIGPLPQIGGTTALTPRGHISNAADCAGGLEDSRLAPGPLASLTPTPAVLQPREFRDAPRTEARPHQNAYPQGRWTRRG